MLIVGCGEPADMLLIELMPVSWFLQRCRLERVKDLPVLVQLVAWHDARTVRWMVEHLVHLARRGSVDSGRRS